MMRIMKLTKFESKSSLFFLEGIKEQRTSFIVASFWSSFLSLIISFLSFFNSFFLFLPIFFFFLFSSSSLFSSLSCWTTFLSVIFYFSLIFSLLSPTTLRQLIFWVFLLLCWLKKSVGGFFHQFLFQMLNLLNFPPFNGSFGALVIGEWYLNKLKDHIFRFSCPLT